MSFTKSLTNWIEQLSTDASEQVAELSRLRNTIINEDSDKVKSTHFPIMRLSTIILVAEELRETVENTGECSVLVDQKTLMAYNALIEGLALCRKN